MDNTIYIYSDEANAEVNAYSASYSMADTSCVNQIIQFHLEAGKIVRYRDKVYLKNWDGRRRPY